MGGSTNDSMEQLSTSARILHYIFRNGSVSRTGISKALGISPALTTALTSALITQGVIENLGETDSNSTGASGRRRMLINFRKDTRYSVGVEIATFMFHFCIMDIFGNSLLSRSFVPTSEQIEHINEVVTTNILRLIEESGFAHSQIAGVGIAVPGNISAASGELVARSPIWHKFNLQLIAQALDLPITSENNVRCMAYQKYLFDSSNCPDSFSFFHMGLAVFCASFWDGVLIGGRDYIFGEIGHTVVNPDGLRCECGKVGCLQTYSSEAWIVSKAKTFYDIVPQSVLHTLASSAEDITFETVLSAFELGDPGVTRIIYDAIRYLSISIANIVIIMRPNKIYLNGRLFQNSMAAVEVRQSINAQLAFEDKKYTEENVRILSYDPLRSAKGAAALAIDELFIRRYE